MLIFEPAKNNNETCKIQLENNQYKYVYSKYAPERVQLQAISQNTQYLVLAGGGLGYEYLAYQEQFSGPIYVLELEPLFQQKLLKIDASIQFIDGEHLQILLKDPSTQLIEHWHVLELYAARYLRIKQSAHTTKKVALLQHTSIQADCTRVFQQLGYEVMEFQWSNEPKLLQQIVACAPSFFMSINFSPTLSKLSKQLQLPYVSWTVDTPAYNLHNPSHFHNWTYTFIYDEVVVERLRAAGVGQVYYLPVAAPVERYRQLTLTEQEHALYRCDVSFLGSRCANNEMMYAFNAKLSDETRAYIEQVVQQQCYLSEPIIERAASPALIERFEQETGYSLYKEEEPLLTKAQRLNYLLGRYHSFVERTHMLEQLSAFGHIHIYGEESWAADFPSSIYKGHAENDWEMPKVFKASKININNIRSFVESGLPQRVFDVLACESFLVTNAKSDLLKYFRDGHDLVVYRDLQDLQEIVAYYLQHEEEREQIAEQGFATVQAAHTFEHRLREVLSILPI